MKFQQYVSLDLFFLFFQISCSKSKKKKKHTHIFHIENFFSTVFFFKNKIKTNNYYFLKYMNENLFYYIKIETL